MTTKKPQNYLMFLIASAITVAAGYGLSFVASSIFEARFKMVQLPIGDTTLILGGMYFAIVLLVGVLIAYFYERFKLS